MYVCVCVCIFWGAWSFPKDNILMRELRSIRDFPGGAVVKNPPANPGDTGLSPGLGRSHMLQSS